MAGLKDLPMEVLTRIFSYLPPTGEQLGLATLLFKAGLLLVPMQTRSPASTTHGNTSSNGE